MIPLTWHVQNRQVYGDRKQIRCQGKEEGGAMAHRSEFLCGVLNNILKLDNCGSCTTLNIQKATALYTLKA